VPASTAPLFPSEDDLLSRPPVARAWVTARLAAGMSQRQACQLLGITTAWMVMIEHGKGLPSNALRRRAADLYGTDIVL